VQRRRSPRVQETRGENYEDVPQFKGGSGRSFEFLTKGRVDSRELAKAEKKILGESLMGYSQGHHDRGSNTAFEAIRDGGGKVVKGKDTRAAQGRGRYLVRPVIKTPKRMQHLFNYP